METLREFVAGISDRVDVIFRARREILPLWHAFTADGRELIFPQSMENKDGECALVRAIFEVEDVVRYAFINEAWTVQQKDDTPEQRAIVRAALRTGATGSPAREEVVMIAAQDRDEGSIMAHRSIIRTGKRPALGPLIFAPPGLSAGRFLDLLPRRKEAMQ